MPHYFSYPRCPKINTFIERYNRTIQEEFIDNNLDIIDDKPLFSKRLADYLIFYNTERPHKSLGLKSPLQYLIEKGVMSQKSLTHT
ncbi:MAG: integrase core domain-containing protein, partial [Thermodesulfobacteriota bacterium]